MPPIDYEEMAARYDRGRARTLDAVMEWREAAAPTLSVGPSGRLLDLGAGTGLWAKAFAEWFRIRVVAVEPAEAMLSTAVRERSGPLISYIRGRAEALPLAGASCDCAWLSTVVHHFSDRDRALEELRRVVKPGGAVLVRSAFAGRTQGVPWLRYFPSARAIAEARWPDVEGLVNDFERHGFRFVRLQPVRETTDPDLAHYARRVRVRADSTLAVLDDEVFQTGLLKLEEAAAGPSGARPVVSTLDLLEVS